MDARHRVALPTRDVVRVLAIIFGFYVGLRLLWIAHPVVFLFFLGVMFGLPIAQGADWFEARKIPRSAGVAIILTVFLGLLIGGGVGMAPILRSQSQELQQRLPEAMDKIDAWLGHRANGVLGILFNESSIDSTRTAPAVAVLKDSTRTDTVVSATSGTIVRTSTTRADTVALGGDLRREITKQFRGAQR
jgi:predicted PurR-regulated permease PerM